MQAAKLIVLGDTPEVPLDEIHCRLRLPAIEGDRGEAQHCQQMREHRLEQRGRFVQPSLTPANLSEPDVAERA